MYKVHQGFSLSPIGEDKYRGISTLWENNTDNKCRSLPITKFNLYVKSSVDHSLRDFD